VGVAPEAIRAQTEAQMNETLDAAIAQAYEGQDSAGAEKHTAYGHPAQALIEASKEADLLVVGRHGRGAFTGMLLGSVSIHCVTGAFCPVVVVRGSNGN
jgi:nucleotide-binding universal stress UspA family protein